MARLKVGFAALLALTFVSACSEEPVGPKKADYSKEREKLQERMARRKGKGPQPRPAPAAKPGETVPAMGAVEVGFSYDPSGKRDPFRSFEWERPDRQLDDAVRGPLEKFDLAQLDLVGVVWETDNAKALVMDPSGQSYIVGVEARIGKNEGRVLSIDDNMVVVKETYVDHLGQKSTKDIEMRIRGSQGG